MTPTQRTLVNRIKKKQPTTRAELRKTVAYCKLRFIGCGAYRDAYEIVGEGLVVKLPQTRETADEYHDPIQHASVEANSCKRINKLKRLSPLRRYMPEIYHHNPRTGVIVMPKYKKVIYSEVFCHFSQFLDHLASDLLNLRYEADFGSANFGYDATGKYVLLDLGILEEF